MATRSRRNRAEDEANAAGVLVVIAVGIYVYRRFVDLPMAWKIAGVVVVASITFLLVSWAVRRVRRRNRQRLLLANAQDLSPKNFELRVKLLLEDLGWERLQHVGGSGDQGVDLRGLRNGERCIVQCKRYGSRVGPTHVRELEGVRIHERADRAFLITTGHFTDQGRDWARGKPIELWDGAMLAQRFQEQQEAARDLVLRQRERKRRWRLVGGLALVNSLVVLWAALTPASSSTGLRAEASGTVGKAAAFTATVPVTPAPDIVTPLTSAIEASAVVDAPTRGICGHAIVSGVTALTIRSGPGAQTQKVGERPAGTVVDLLCDAPIDVDGRPWRHVRSGNVEGWMSTRFLKVTLTQGE